MNIYVTIFLEFLKLGLTSFGGPAAHLGYFRQVFVNEKAWISDSDYAQLIAMSQFLPGPGSSQVGFAIGMRQAGIPGGIMAFIGFTLPSFFLMALAGIYLSNVEAGSGLDSLISGLKILALIVVLDATVSMAKSFCTNLATMVISVLTATCLVLSHIDFLYLFLLIAAAVYGALYFPVKTTASTAVVLPNRGLLLVFALLFIVSTLGFLGLLGETYLAGSLVFGGGHVVLPLLYEIVGDQVSHQQFLAGYSLAQAIPGPMFTLASYLGAVVNGAGFIGAIVATLGIFLPGFILVVALLPSWQSLMAQPRLAGAVVGVNAAVVGLLAATCYQPVFVSAIQHVSDFLFAATLFFFYQRKHLPITGLIGLCVLWGLLLGVFSI